MYLFIHSFMNLFIHSFVHTFIHLSINPSIHPSIHSSIHPSIHPFIHLSLAKTGRLATFASSLGKIPLVVMVTGMNDSSELALLSIIVLNCSLIVGCFFCVFIKQLRLNTKTVRNILKVLDLIQWNNALLSSHFKVTFFLLQVIFPFYFSLIFIVLHFASKSRSCKEADRSYFTK